MIALHDVPVQARPIALVFVTGIFVVVSFKPTIPKYLLPFCKWNHDTPVLLFKRKRDEWFNFNAAFLRL